MSDADLVLITYSTKPRGGVVHTLALAEALHATGTQVHVLALGDPAAGFFRPVAAPTTIVPGPPGDGTLEEKVFGSIDRLAVALTEFDAPVLHAQDCIGARAAARVRDAGAAVTVVRTVHHVDDFSSQILMDCQRSAILEPDVVLAVSQAWQQTLEQDYGVQAGVIPNGVDLARFSSPERQRTAELREQVGATGRPLILAVGGIEPRKGSDTLVRALAEMKANREISPVLAVIGGHSFQDHRPYRERVLGLLPELGLALGVDVVPLGMVPDVDIPQWYAAADVLAFPSVKEGFGLAVLEAMSAGTPVVTSDLPVFREYLVAGRDALLIEPGDVGALAAALLSTMEDPALRHALISAGAHVAARFTWQESARQHLAIYEELPHNRRAAAALSH